MLTTITDSRRALFRDWETASTACATLSESRLWRDSDLLCWVLMPDHLHALVELGKSETLSRLMQRVKAVSAKALSSGAGPRRVWMPGFHDRALRQEENVPAVARYVVMNPVRAEMVASLGDYPFWDAIWV